MTEETHKKSRGGETSYWHFSPRNYLMLILGVIGLVAGFGMLILVDSRAENAFGIIAPGAIIIGYCFIFVALLLEKHDH